MEPTALAAKIFSSWPIPGLDCGRTAAGLNRARRQAWLQRTRIDCDRIEQRRGPASYSVKSRTNMGNQALRLNKYSVGTGDRFAHQAKAQLQACVKALQHGVEVVPVWNKSNREHNIIGSEPTSVRQAADAAGKAFHWEVAYYRDAEHISAASGGAC